MEHTGKSLIKQLLRETAQKNNNSADVVSMNIPFLIRVMEYSKEDAKTDMDLHKATEKMIELSKNGKTLTMDDYESIFGGKTLDEGFGKTIATAALGGALAFGGMNAAKAQNPFQKIKDKVSNTIGQVTNKQDNSPKEFLAPPNAETFAQAKTRMESKANENVVFGIGKTSSQSLGLELAKSNASTSYMQKHNLNNVSASVRVIENHTYKTADGSFITIGLFEFITK